MIRDRNAEVPFDETIELKMKGPPPRVITIRPSSNDGYTLREIFVQEVYANVRKHVSDAGCVMDLGTNIGLASVYFISQWPGAKLFCVEPDDSNIKLIYANLAREIEQGRCRVMKGAVWGRTETVCLSPLEKGHVNQRSCVAPANERGDLSCVQAYSMPDLISLAGFPFVDLLKIDVEGAEREMFSANTEWLDLIGTMAIEFHGSSRQQSGFDAVIAKHGFKVVEESEHTVIAAKSASPCRSCGKPAGVK